MDATESGRLQQSFMTWYVDDFHLFPFVGSLKIEYTLADTGARKLWKLLKSEPYVPALGALSGNQAMQQVRAGLKAIYCSGWQANFSV